MGLARDIYKDQKGDICIYDEHLEVAWIHKFPIHIACNSIQCVRYVGSILWKFF